MYRVDGSSDLNEEVLSHWEGYRGSFPVRIGNGAADQLQLDIYGEALDSVYFLHRHGQEVSYQGWQAVCDVLDWLVDHWDQAEEAPDAAQDPYEAMVACDVAPHVSQTNVCETGLDATRDRGIRAYLVVSQGVSKTTSQPLPHQPTSRTVDMLVGYAPISAVDEAVRSQGALQEEAWASVTAAGCAPPAVAVTCVFCLFGALVEIECDGIQKRTCVGECGHRNGGPGQAGR